jgi:hypothetical protein
VRPITLIVALMLTSLVACQQHEAPIPGDQSTDAVKSAVYQIPVQPLAAGGNCALDSVNGAPAANASLKTGTSALFAGWMGDAQKQVPEKAELIFKGQGQSYQYPLRAGGRAPGCGVGTGRSGSGQVRL